MRITTITAASVTALGTASGAAPPAFTNVSFQAGIQVDYHPLNFPQDQYGASACVGDFNRDGLQDLYVCSGGQGGPDHLFINDGDGGFTDRAAEWGCDVTHDGKGIAVGDYNNDGWLDVYVVSAPVGGVLLWRNNNGESFTNVAAEAGVVFPNPNSEDTWFGCFGDYDLDGDLDLFSAGHHGPPYSGGKLFRNNADGTFTDVTDAMGVWNNLDGVISAFAGSFTDMNGDRYPELLVTADFECSGQEGSKYWRNFNGVLSEITDAAGVGLEANGMGQTRGDFNNDGLCDWYTTTIFGFCGGDVNRLYLNQGGHAYIDVGAASGAGAGKYGWGAVAVDFNHDGLLDIGETNGPTQNPHARLFMNDGAASFTEQSAAAGLNHDGWGRSMLHLDYDNDGDQDVVIHSANETLALFRNDVMEQEGADANYLRIFLDTSADDALAPDGYGSKVSVTANGLTMHRWIDGGNSFLGISELSAHVGLGAAAAADEVRVLWNNGEETVLAEVAANQTITIQAPAPPAKCPTDLDGSGATDSADLNLVLASFGQDDGADVDADGDTDSADLNLLLAVFGQTCE